MFNKFFIFFALAVSAFGQCAADSRGVAVTGLTAIQDNLLGPLICWGSSQWPYADLSEKGVVDYMAPIAIGLAPALGTALSGTTSWTQGDNHVNTTANLTGPLAGKQWVAFAWNSVDGTGTGRALCPIASVTSTLITCSENFSEPSSSGVTAYLLPAADVTSGCDFQCWTIENPGSGPQSWNYYDVAIGLYRLYYRTLNSTYLTYARAYADINWQWNIDHGYRTVAPRAAAMVSQFFRALDGHPERFSGLYNLISIYRPSWATYPDRRESGYWLLAAAEGAKTDSDATRHAQYCTWLGTYAAYWNSIQQADGSWGEDEFSINAGYVSAPKSYTLPIVYQGSPWREAINIKAMEAVYESLMDTTLQGCNDPTLAAAVLVSITKAVTWQNNYGRDTSNRGAFYEVNSMSQDNSSVGGTGTASINVGSATLTGSGTNWSTAGMCDGTHFVGIRGGLVGAADTVYKINSCASNTTATLSVNYGFFSETVNVSGAAIVFAPSSSTGCASSATYCYGPVGDRNLTRTMCGGMAWLYAKTFNSTYRDWANECVSATLGGPTAGLDVNVNIGFTTLPCGGPACDGFITDIVASAKTCGAAPCIYSAYIYSNQGKNYGEGFGAPGIQNAEAWGKFNPAVSSITSQMTITGKSSTGSK